MPITRGSDSNNSGRVVLGRRNIVFAAFLLLPPELLFNPDRFMFEGNSIPCQSEYLTLSKAHKQRSLIQILVEVALDGF